MREDPHKETQEAHLLPWEFKFSLHFDENKRMLKSLEIATGNQQTISLSLTMLFTHTSAC